MQEIRATTVTIKVSDGHEDKHVLVHDGRLVIALVEQGQRVATHQDNRMLVGTRQELEAEIQRLGLAPAKDRPAQDDRPGQKAP